MLKKLLMLSILSAAILSHCSDGCIQCDLENDRCKFCDIQRGFKTVRGECMKVYSNNCAIFNFEGFCIHCEKGYFLDTFAMRCVPVPEIGLVENCDSYSADNICYKCVQGYHLLHNNTCIEISTTIDKCLVYRSSELCQKCQVGYQLTLDFKKCEKPSEIQNCVSFTKMQCQQCKVGYKKNPNNYLRILFGFQNSIGMRQLENKLIQEYQEDLLPVYNTCQKLNIDNCQVYSTHNECAKCMPNYYLQQNKCIEYPKERILNCLRYKSLVECVECQEGMHLKTELECQLNDKVDDCIMYDSTAMETTCKQCAATHYLSEFNVCTQRTVLSDIANCVQLSHTSETCDKCVENFSLTSDKKKCLSRVPNCKQHEDSDVTTLQLICKVCVEGFYYDQESQSCKEGTISKCVRYSRLSNSCEECENRYFLAGGLCRTHEDLVYCDTYNKVKKNSCSICNDKTVLLFRLNTCLPVEYIENCNVYETQTKCKQCNDGYELNNDKQCQQIPGSEFCLQKLDNNCVKCLESYVLQDGTCQIPLAHVTRNCASYNLNGLLNYSQLTCNYCKENTIPMNYKFSYTCYEKKYLENQLDIDTNDKCLKYKEVNGNYQCVGCVKEYLLLDGQCIEGPYCPTTHTLRLQVIQQLDVDSDGNFDSFYVEKVNECGPKINNCKVASPDLLQDQTNVRYSCVTCDEGMISVVEFSDKKVLMRPPRFKGDKTFSPLNHTSAKVCKDPTNEQVLGRVENDNCIKNCELYQYLTGFGLGCQKCEHGMTGRIYDLIHKCLKYSSLTSCTQCDNGFYPLHSYQCVRVQPVQYCLRYDGSDSLTKGQCKECMKDFYVDNNQCKERDTFVNYCDKYNPDNQQCKDCKQGYFLLNNQCHKKIYKCKKYTNSTTCQLCEDQYYLLNNLCYKGSDVNCIVYEQENNKVNKCKLCANKFYLKDNKCIAFENDIINCNQYSQENTYCNKCDPGYLLFYKQKQCNQVKTIANCKEYGTRESCRLCNPGYYPVNYGLRCLSIPTSKNCLEWGPLTKGLNYDEDNCLKCKDSTYLLINKKCRQWFNAVTQNCQQYVDTMNGTQSFFKCKYCNSGMTPMSVDKEGLCLESDILDSFPAVPSIKNCVRYTMQNAELKCLQCDTDFYVMNQTSCVSLDQCKQTNGYYPTKLVIDTSSDDNTNIKQGASCINDANKFADVSNCIYQPVISGTFLGGTGQYKYGCVKCMTGYLSIIKMANTNKRMAYSLDNDNINSTIPVFDECKKPTDIELQGTPNSNNEIDNCNIYSRYSDDTKYFCLSCKSKYRGKVKPGQIPSDTNNISPLYSYIDQCVSFNDCSSNIVDAQSMIPSAKQYLDSAYKNIFDMGILFSGCNKCNDSTKALVAFINVSTTDGSNTYSKITGLGAIKGYTGSAQKGDTVNDSDGFSYDCLTISSNNFTFADKTYGEIANCQKYIINANTLTTTAATHSATTTVDYACVQCKPGYKAKRALDSDASHIGQEIITECVQITNCKNVANTTQPNICDECNDNYAFKFDTTKSEILLDTCILTDKQNCYSASDSECKICKTGYKLNQTSGNCEQKKPPKCDVYNPYIDTHLTKKYVRYSFKFMKNTSGCVKCENGFIPMQYANNYLQAIQLEEVKKVCVNGSVTQTLTETIDQCTTSNLRQNLRTEYDSNVVLRVDCVDCDATYIETLDGKCILQSNNANCLLVESSTNNYCVKCDTNYLSIAGVCKTNSALDPNCDQFADMSFRTGALCKKCKDGFYLVTEVIDNLITTSCQQYTDTAIQNCAQFDSTDLSRLFCVECNTNYALMILDGDEVNGLSGYNRLCLNVSGKVQEQCAEFSISAQSNGQFICQKCNNDYILEDIQGNQNVCVNTLTTVDNCAEVHINDQLEKLYQGIVFKNNYFPRLSSLKCLKCEDTFYLQTNTNSCAPRTRTNNATYDNQCNQFEDLDDYCKVCNENYFLSGDKTQCIPAPIMTHSQGSLFSCTKMQQCKKDIYRTGLDSHIDSLLSCHECKKSNEIPFIAISGEIPYKTITGLNQYDIKNGENNFTNLIGGKSNFCAEPVPATFNIDNTNNDKFTFPNNCAIGVLNVDTGVTLDAFHANQTTNVDLNKIQVFCAACKPGYKFVQAKDTTNKLVPYMAGACEPITNCKYSTAFNNCTECKKGFAFDYKNGEVQYDTCVAVTNNEDCYANDTTNNKCQFCCKGTYLNKDGLCERIQPPKCEYNQYISKQIYRFQDLNTGLYLSEQGTGCNRCVDGFYALYKPQNHWVCTESEAHYNNLLPQQTEYIQNCVNYFQENEALKCKKCKDGFVPIKQEGLCTAINTGLQNCLFALSDIHCEICEEDFVLVNRACQQKNIDKCYQYTYNIESHQQVCIDCEAGYYLEANTCLPGNVKNCLLYETNTVCNKCNPGFHLVKRNDGVSYCYPIDKRLNCAKFDSNEFQKGRLQCTQCQTNQFVISTDYDQYYSTHCLKFFETPNCVKYDIKPAIADSSFSCQQCTSNFYLSDQECQVRTVQPQFCIKYSMTQDVCSQCEDGYFVNQDGTQCNPYPVGTPNCRLYTDAHTCVSCQTNYYLSNSLCILIEEDFRVDNCLYYVGPNLCDQCNDGFLNLDGQCQKIQAQNCAEVESLLACASCPQGFGFVEENSIKSCVQQSIANCVDFDPNPEYKCLQCEPKFYVNTEGACVAIVTEIPHCLVYAEEGICQRCESNTALSQDKSKCLINRLVVEQMDQNCNETQVMENYQCRACKDGYVFVEEKCQSCELENNENCKVCDPMHLNQCLICKTGYYMNTDNICVKYEPPVIDVDDYLNPPSDESPETPTDQNENTLKLATFITMMALIHFLI